MTTTLAFVTEAVEDDLASTKLKQTSDGIRFATNTIYAKSTKLSASPLAL
jgi:hypothetical protein